MINQCTYPYPDECTRVGMRLSLHVAHVAFTCSYTLHVYTYIAISYG